MWHYILTTMFIGVVTVLGLIPADNVIASPVDLANLYSQTVIFSPPSAPTQLDAVTYGTTMINLTWRDNTIEEDGFRVERAKDAVFSQESVSFFCPFDTVAYSDEQIIPANKYYYRVFAFNEYGESPPSNVASAGWTRIAIPDQATEVISLNNKIDKLGRFTSPLEWSPKTVNTKFLLKIDKGTAALDKETKPIKELSVSPTYDLPLPPSPGYYITGVIYDFGPSGATFSPPLSITLTYDKGLLPRGADEEDLFMVYFDEVIKKWMKLADYTLDMGESNIVAKAGHFCPFAVMGRQYNTPAFETSELVITPPQPTSKDTITVSCTITNTGELAGTHDLTLMLEDAVVGIHRVNLAGQETQKVAFTLGRLVANSYKVTVGDLSETMVVKEVEAPAPRTASPSEPMVIPLPAPEPSVSSTPAAEPTTQIPLSEPASIFDRWTIISIVCGAIILGLVVVVLMKRE
jgi:hypothetical protein